MKKVLSVAAFLALSACGVASESTVSSQMKPVPAVPAMFSNKSDNTLNQIKITTNRLMGYNITQTYLANNHGVEKLLVAQATCEAKFHSVSTKLLKLTCGRDRRPVDGMLTHVIFTVQKDGLYTAELSQLSTITFDDVPAEITVLGRDLAFERIFN